MTEIAFLILAHKDPAGLAATIRLLVGAGDRVALHFDRNAPAAAFAALRTEFAGNPSVAFAPRLRCGWGEWSLVAATLALVRTARAAFPGATHFAMLSGDCAPIKPRAHIARVLAPADRDYIEHHDFFESDWIRTGLKAERLVYRHYVNERSRKRLFYALLWLQRRLGLERALPAGLRIRIGSQWWVLRRGTLDRVLAFLDARPDVLRFFRTTWIPDETFFQTLVAHVTPRAEVANRTLTFLAFSDYGLPLVLHDDHADLLLAEDHLFARKVAPGAKRLRARLAAQYAGPAEVAQGGGRALALYRFETARGRTGLREAPRDWEAGGRLGPGRALHLVACKKWHVARRLSAALARPGLAAFGHIFDEEEAGLPPLGNLSAGRLKRGRNRRAFLATLCEATGTARLLFCIDPSAAGFVAELAADGAALRVLLVSAPLDDAYLDGHADRLGLAGGATPPETRARLRRVLSREIAAETAALRAAAGPALDEIGPGRAAAANADALARFLGVTADEAAGIVALPGIFD